jgi:hypothetical protein
MTDNCTITLRNVRKNTLAEFKLPLISFGQLLLLLRLLSLRTQAAEHSLIGYIEGDFHAATLDAKTRGDQHGWEGFSASLSQVYELQQRYLSAGDTVNGLQVVSLTVPASAATDIQLFYSRMADERLSDLERERHIDGGAYVVFSQRLR